MRAKKLIPATEILAATEIKEIRDKSLINWETCFVEVFTTQEEQIISGGRQSQSYGGRGWQRPTVRPPAWAY